MSKPILIKPIKSCSMKQRVLVHLDVHEHFSGGDLPLTFSLVGVTPSWLVIGANTGLILGETPTVAHNVQYLVSVRASNDEGEVVEHFLLKVSAETFMTSMTSVVLNLSRNKSKYGSLDHHFSAHEVLQYLYEYYTASKEWALFEGLIREEASIMNIKVSNKITYQEFRKVVRAKNPSIETHIRKQLGNDHLLVEAEMRNDDMRNMYRQGSQPQGVYPRQVWNYLGAPSLHNWSHMKTVLHESVEKIVERFELAHEKELHKHNLNTPELTLHPKDWPKE